MASQDWSPTESLIQQKINRENILREQIREEARKQLAIFYEERKKFIEEKQTQNRDSEYESKDYFDENNFWKSLEILINLDQVPPNAQRMFEIISSLISGNYSVHINSNEPESKQIPAKIKIPLKPKNNNQPTPTNSPVLPVKQTPFISTTNPNFFTDLFGSNAEATKSSVVEEHNGSSPKPQLTQPTVESSQIKEPSFAELPVTADSIQSEASNGDINTSTPLSELPEPVSVTPPTIEANIETSQPAEESSRSFDASFAELPVPSATEPTTTQSEEKTTVVQLEDSQLAKDIPSTLDFEAAFATDKDTSNFTFTESNSSQFTPASAFEFTSTPTDFTFPEPTAPTTPLAFTNDDFSFPEPSSSSSEFSFPASTDFSFPEPSSNSADFNFPPSNNSSDFSFPTPAATDFAFPDNFNDSSNFFNPSDRSDDDFFASGDDDDFGFSKKKKKTKSYDVDDDDDLYGGSHSSDEEDDEYDNDKSNYEEPDIVNGEDSNTGYFESSVSVESFLVKRILTAPNGDAILLEQINDKTDSLIEHLRGSTENKEKIQEIMKAARTPDKKESILHIAASTGCTSWLEFALEMGCPDSSDYQQNTPLHLAAATGNFLAAKILIDAKFNVNSLNVNCRTPLHMACVNGKLRCARLLIENKADIQLKDKDGLTLLHLACLRGNASLVSYLLEFFKQQYEIEDYNGRTPLLAASHSGDWDCCKLLLSKNANIQHFDFQHRSALIWCLTQPNFIEKDQTVLLDCFKNLIQAGANIKELDKKNRSCLHYGCFYGLDQIVDYIISNQLIDINSLDSNKQTPLHAAVACADPQEKKTVSVVKLLLDNNATILSTNSDNKQISLHVAACLKKSNTVGLLLERLLENMDDILSCKDQRNRSILQYLVENNLTQLAMDLINKFPQLVSHVDSNGWNVFHSLAKGGSSELLQFILTTQNTIGQSPESSDKVVNTTKLLSAKDKKRRNVFHIAAGLDNYEIIKLISKTLPKELVEQLHHQHDRFGNMPIHYAALRSKFETLDFLLDSFPSLISATTKNDQTLLHACIAGTGNIDCLKMLLSFGCDVDATDDSGMSPIFYAVRPKDSLFEVIKILIADFSADITIKNDDGKSFTAFVASSEDCERILSILDEHSKE